MASCKNDFPCALSDPVIFCPYLTTMHGYLVTFLTHRLCCDCVVRPQLYTTTTYFYLTCFPLFRKFLRSAHSFKVWNPSTLELNRIPSRNLKEYYKKSCKNFEICMTLRLSNTEMKLTTCIAQRYSCFKTYFMVCS